MSDQRRDYGPAGCMDGCAKNGGCGCLLVVVSMASAVVMVLRHKVRR